MAHPTEAAVLGEITFSLIVTLLILGWLTVFLRLWVRLRITRSPGWDDATMILTLILFTCYCAFILVITVRGSVSHLPTAKEVLQTLVFVQLGEVFYILTTTTLKISLGLFFMRVLTKKWQMRIFHTILIVSATYGVFYVLTTLFACGNPAKLADTFLGSSKCLPSGFILATGYLYGVLNIIADFTFVLIPIVILIDSDMDRRSKISISIVMGLGAIGSIASVLRMVYLRGLLFRGNITIGAIKATIWATAEPGTGIIAASIAILRPLFRKISTEVREKLSDYSVSKTSRITTTGRQDTIPRHNDSMIALTSVVTAGNNNSRGSKKDPRYSIQDEDPWDTNVTVGHAQIGKVVSIRMTEEEYRPPVPPKD